MQSHHFGRAASDTENSFGRNDLVFYCILVKIVVGDVEAFAAMPMCVVDAMNFDELL